MSLDEPVPALPHFLEREWDRALRSGLVAYDPAGPHNEVVVTGRFRHHFLPQRATRPGAHRPYPAPAEGVRLPHAPCPFDGASFVSEREVLRFVRADRVYHLTCNRFPVTSIHYLPVRSETAPTETLPQCLHGPEEIEDMLLLLDAAGPPYHAFFNSNRGADNSQSGSSVNHWHFQLFPYEPAPDGPLLDDAIEPLCPDFSGPVVRAHVNRWPACHELLEAPRGAWRELSRELWSIVQRLHALNIAYNIDAAFRTPQVVRIFAFPRSPSPEVVVPGAGVLTANFGGWELTGDIVIPTAELLEWIRAHPREAEAMTAKRLRASTRSIA